MRRIVSSFIWVAMGACLWAIVAFANPEPANPDVDHRHSAHCLTCRYTARERAASPVDWSKVDWNEVRVIGYRKPATAEVLPAPHVSQPIRARLAAKRQA